MDIFENITKAINDFLISVITGNLSTMFNDVNEKVQTIGTEVGKTPSEWNIDIFNMIRSLSDNVILPIAGLIITYVLCYEIISMVMDKNNMHDVDTFMFFKYFLKSGVAIWIVSNAFTIIMAVFDLAQNIVTQSALIIGSEASIDISSVLNIWESNLSELGTGELFLLVIETSLISICMKVLSICITVIVFGRMIEIYLYCSVGAIPFATMTNREWGQIGNNYLRGIIALAFQGFFIMVCIAIYSALVNSFAVTEDVHKSIFSIASYTFVLCFALFKTGSISKSVFNAH